jgi:hypothetical protein
MILKLKVLVTGDDMWWIILLWLRGVVREAGWVGQFLIR